MMVVSARIEGTARLRTRLGQAGAAVNRAVRRTLHQGANAIADDAQARVLRQRSPEQPLPSELADSVTVAPVPGGVTVTAGAPHAAAVEFGTRRQAAEPFLHPAYEASRDDIARAVRIAAAEAMRSR